jgi:hypothetical protein
MRYVVPLSGGKDSTALALRLAETLPGEYTYIFNETGDDFSDLLIHLEAMSLMLGAPIERVGCGQTLNELIQIQNALPSWRMRWCTRKLKIEPTIAWLKKNSPAVVYVGIRADEANREGIYGDIPGVEFRFPFQEWGWGIDEVWRYLAEKNIRIPRRGNCKRCYGQRLSEWWELWLYHPETYREAEAQEKATGHTFRSPQRDSWPASLEAMRVRFEAGERPRGADLQFSLELDQHSPCRVCSL